jgi:hypothetical protein
MPLKRNPEDMSEPAQKSENPEDLEKSPSEPMDPQRQESAGSAFGSGQTTDADPEHREENRASWNSADTEQWNDARISGEQRKASLETNYVASEANTLQNRESSRISRFEQARRDRAQEEQKQAQAQQKKSLPLASDRPSQEYVDQLEQTPVEQLVDKLLRVRMARYRPGRIHAERQDTICLCCGRQYRPDDIMDGTNMFICSGCLFDEEEEIELEKQANEQFSEKYRKTFAHG